MVRRYQGGGQGGKRSALDLQPRPISLVRQTFIRLAEALVLPIPYLTWRSISRDELGQSKERLRWIIKVNLRSHLVSR